MSSYSLHHLNYVTAECRDPVQSQADAVFLGPRLPLPPRSHHQGTIASALSPPQVTVTVTLSCWKRRQANSLYCLEVITTLRRLHVLLLCEHLMWGCLTSPHSLSRSPRVSTLDITLFHLVFLVQTVFRKQHAYHANLLRSLRVLPSFSISSPTTTLSCLKNAGYHYGYQPKGSYSEESELRFHSMKNNHKQDADNDRAPSLHHRSPKSPQNPSSSAKHPFPKPFRRSSNNARSRIHKARPRSLFSNSAKPRLRSLQQWWRIKGRSRLRWEENLERSSNTS